MARLPSEEWLVQQHDGLVSIFHEHTGTVIVTFDPAIADDAAKAQKTIYDSELSAEDKCFAHFWSGYFYAHARGIEYNGWTELMAYND